ncbi:Stress responsive alpha-beta barrel domain protein, putative isoform 2 [Hibiscus syriacus]|uniref:Stress responsive alpha-beta barrel domain protein, putative isoform 2 n=1 Tax=Hibiscus syriacus TaxID=106335 RepID=A0A6A3B858_HIBSY|nr:Stress responsive alpha-beta barrel domain protein, putative isoform 2 [Hibiscus syriacus]
MVNGLNSLAFLDPVLHLTVGPVFRTRSPISDFTHMLHCRYKSKEGLSAYSAHPEHVRKSDILGVIKGIKDGVSGVQQITCGENFSPGRAKGFSIASVAVFSGVGEMAAAEGNEEYVNLQKQKVRDHLNGVIVVDYVMPSSSSSNL